MEAGTRQFEFLGVLAHELKAPLSAVQGYMDILLDGKADQRPELRQQMLERSSLRLKGMRKLIDDMLDLCRIESGQRPRKLAPLDLREVAQWALETASSRADAQHVLLHLETEHPVPFVADRSEIEIVLNNLISNAVKYNCEGGLVSVSVWREDRRAKISVRDTGIGMTEEEIRQAFDAFARIRNEKTQHIQGSGLGLSILRKLALLYRGDVSVVSEPGAGSTFTVTLHEPEPFLCEQDRAAFTLPHAS